jgi:fatty-acyl-CoA synthase
LRHGARTITWGEFDRRANALAADLLSAGLGHQAKVAAYLYNGPEYIETYAASFKAGLVPVNTNYRYGDDEIVYLFDNADAQAVVFHASLTEIVDRVRGRLPKVRRWYCVADETGPCPSWATDYERLVAPGCDRVVASWGRSGDDLLLLYTGGTTGMPKGVMWRQDDLFNVTGAGGQALLGYPPRTSVEELSAGIDPAAEPLVVLSACPQMHGTGQFTSMLTLNLGGTVVTLPSRKFDVGELWDEVASKKASSIVIVGQAFAGPMLDELDANPTARDLSSLKLISSSGVMWSHENKQGLLAHLPGVMLFDSFGSSEAVGLGGSISTKGNESATAKFMLGPNCAVFIDDASSPDGVRRVEPGSAEQGMVAVSGFIPLGYYKDEAKPQRHSGRMKVAAGAFLVTSPKWRSMARCICWDEVRNASTPAAKRCSPKKSRKQSRPTPRFATPCASACPTLGSAK